MEKICKDCKWWNNRATADRDLFPGKCMVLEINVYTCFDISCPRFVAKEVEMPVPYKLKSWIPVWRTMNTLPCFGKLVLMMYSGDVITPKVGFYENGQWFKRTCSRTERPSWWTELP